MGFSVLRFFLKITLPLRALMSDDEGKRSMRIMREPPRPLNRLPSRHASSWRPKT
jgi:hypothetical protein